MILMNEIFMVCVNISFVSSNRMSSSCQVPLFQLSWPLALQK